MPDLSAWLIFGGSILAAFSTWWFQESKSRRVKDGLIFFGAALAIAGGIWSSSQQTKYEHEISALTRTTLANVTGGDAYCYIKAGPVDNAPRYWALTLSQVGEQPCYDVTVQTKDVDAYQRVKGDQLPPGKLIAATTEMKALGTVSPKFTAPVLRILDLDGLTERKFSFVITTRNGYVSQKLALRKVNEQWKRASEGIVHFLTFPERGIDETEEGFPLESDGKVKW